MKDLERELDQFAETICDSLEIPVDMVADNLRGYATAATAGYVSGSKLREASAKRAKQLAKKQRKIAEKEDRTSRVAAYARQIEHGNETLRYFPRVETAGGGIEKLANRIAN